MKRLAFPALCAVLLLSFAPSLAAQCGSEIPIVTPTEGSTVPKEFVTLKWSAVPGVNSYDVFFGPIGPGVCTGTPKATVTGTEWSPPQNEVADNQTYGWRVVANGTACTVPPPPSTPCASFNTNTAPACQLAAPTLVSPNAGYHPYGQVTFDWDPVANATSYELFTSVDNDPPSSHGLTTQTSKTLFIEPGRFIKWGVVAHAQNCASGTSAVSTFTTNCPDEVPTLIAPQHNARFDEGSAVTFLWNAVVGAAGYDLYVSSNAGATYDVLVENLTGRTHTATLAKGEWSWYIRANYDGDCDPGYSQPSQFTVGSDAECSTDGPLLLSPANGANSVASPVTFKWRSVRGATRYAVFVAINSDDFAFYGTTQETELEGFVPDGTIRWLVAAIFPNCPETRSAVSTFTAGDINDCPQGTISLRSPADGATVSAPVTLSWSALAGVDFYRVTVILSDETSVVRRTTATEHVFDLPAGAMRWYVEGLSEGCDPILSNQGRFTVQRATNCATNPAPTLIAPLGTQANPVAATSPVTFSWNAAAGALGYRVWISRNGKAFEDVGLTDKTAVTIPLPGGEYSWFLDALFRNCDPLPSTRGFFVVADTIQRCPSNAPAPLAPANGSTAAAPVRFSWTEVAAAEKYRVFVSIDGSEERLIGTTEETSLERVLPPGAATWRVEATAAECRALSSGIIPFTIPEASNCSDDEPELVSPANGATLNEQEVEFVWTPVSGAVRYVIIAKTEDGSPVPVGDSAETTFRRRMPFGRNEWWIVAFFAGCEPVESDHFQFTITRDENCSNRSPILLQPSESTRGVYSPVTFAWTRVPGAIGYQIWVPQGSPVMNPTASIIASTTETTATVDLPPGTYQWYVVARFATCAPTESAIAEFEVKEPVPCGTPDQPTAQVLGQALSGTPYRLRWTPLPNVDVYEVQESTSLTFESAQTTVVERPVLLFEHEVTAPLQYHYRVRGISNCDDSRGPYSDPVSIFIIPPRTNNASAEVGVEGTIVQTVTLPASPTPLPFVAKVDKPWLTVTPSSGVVHTTPVTLTVTADPSVLFLGTNTGTVTVEYTTPSNGKIETNGTTFSSVPVSISLVTPVTPVGKGTPPPDALIFPIVGHATGVNDSLFESDIRIANLTPQTMKYQVNFTPSGTDGTQTGSSTTIEVPPNTTTALDDIVASVFGTGTLSSALGMLEVRPLTTSTTSPSLFSTVSSAFPALATAASSRTYNFTPNGTYGQFIPAIPFSKFVGKGSILSLLQVAQSADYRANFGFAEAGGSPVDLLMRVYDTKNVLLATIPVSLGATQHTQMNGLLAQNGINDLADGRVEVEVVNGDGKVTAYVSELDNRTSDPLLVNAVPKGATSANRYVVPGMAYIDNGFAFWVSDLRIFNAGTTSTPATVTFYPQGNGTPVSRDITLDAGEIEVLNNVVSSLFGQPNGAGGAIAITTPTNTQLSATARTYNQTSNGTYGQFIPGVTVAESVGNGDRALQLLQLETSSRFRTNVGVTETSGNPVRVELTAIQPDSIVTPIITVDLAAGEFRQISLADFFEAGAAVYNARVTVKVISGTGRVTAYGSAIDVTTQDPTYVPAQ